jgi:hypothetical protein
MIITIPCSAPWPAMVARPRRWPSGPAAPPSTMGAPVPTAAQLLTSVVSAVHKGQPATSGRMSSCRRPEAQGGTSPRRPRPEGHDARPQAGLPGSAEVGHSGQARAPTPPAATSPAKHAPGCERSPAGLLPGPHLCGISQVVCRPGHCPSPALPVCWGHESSTARRGWHKGEGSDTRRDQDRNEVAIARAAHGGSPGGTAAGGSSRKASAGAAPGESLARTTERLSDGQCSHRLLLVRGHLVPPG